MNFKKIIEKTNKVYEEILLNQNINQDFNFLLEKSNEKFNDAYLLTGANGFLSQFIIKELLINNKTVIAVVRNKEKYEIDDKIIDENQKSKIILIDYEDIFFKNEHNKNCNHVQSIKQEFISLLKQRNINLKGIIHCAAQLNNLYSYEKLEEANVKLTQKLLSCFYSIPFHYISTLSIFASSNKKGIIEEKRNYIDEILNKLLIVDSIKKYQTKEKVNQAQDENKEQNINIIKYDLENNLIYLSNKEKEFLEQYEIYGGYAQTKMVSDYLVRKCDLIKNKVYRFDLITPPYVNINHDFRIIKEKQNNKDEKNDFKKVYENTLLKTFFEIPDKENHKKYKKIKVSMNPVDLCAKSFITTLLNNEENKKKFIFHFAGQEISLYDLIKTKSKNKSTDLCSKEKLWKSKVHFKLYKNTYYRKKLDFENNDFYKHKKLFNLDLFQTTGFKWKINNRQQRSFYDKIFYIKKLKKLNIEI